MGNIISAIRDDIYSNELPESEVIWKRGNCRLVRAWKWESEQHKSYCVWEEEQENAMGEKVWVSLTKEKIDRLLNYLAAWFNENATTT